MGRDEHIDSVTDVQWPSSERVRLRQRRYLQLVAVSIALMILAWTWARPLSTPLAVAMTAVAAVLWSIAAYVGNKGLRGG